MTNCKNRFSKAKDLIKIGAMTIQKTMVLFIALISLMSGIAFAEDAPASLPQNPLEQRTFLDCYQKVLAHYPALQKRYEQLEQAKARRNIAVADLFPHIQGFASMTTTTDPVNVFGMLLRQNKFTEGDFALNKLNDPNHRTDYHFGISGEMLLFDSFNTISKIRAARRLVKSADLQADFTEMEAGIVALESYLGILLARQTFDHVSAVKNQSVEDLKQAEDLNQKGMILGADFYAAKVTSAGIERELNQARTLLKNAYMFMNILMGEDLHSVWDAKGKLPEIKQDTAELNMWTVQAYQQRKDLAALDQMIDAQRIESLRHKTSFFPKIYGFANLNEHTPDWHTGGQDYTIGIKGTMDFFDPSYPGRVKEAKHYYEELKKDREMLRDNITRDLVEELARYETATADHPVLRQAYEDARQASDLTAKLYQEGRKSILDLLNMRRVYLETAVGLDQLLFALELEHAKLLFLSGQLDEDGVHRVNTRLSGAN